MLVHFNFLSVFQTIRFWVGVVFCPKCGSLMRPVKKSKSDGKVVLLCNNCGFTKDPDFNDRKRFIIKEKKQVTGDDIIVVDKTGFGNNIDYAVVCPKCGSKGAYYINHYDLSSDSGFTIYKCFKCGHTWREED